jgi:cupin fold WbuC family metalloprotein
MISFIKESDEVYYTSNVLTHISKEDLEHFKNLANQNPRKRFRLCAHNNKGDSLHEMFIVHKRECYVRPHKHIEKAESMSIIEGEVDVILFEDDGIIKDIIQMGDLKSGKLFYQRISEPIYHSLIIRSEYLVFHEITQGPFLREKTIFAPWAPQEKTIEVNQFINGIESKINQLKESI